MYMNRLKELRKETGKKQDELAARLGVTRQAISRYEKGERDLDTDTIRRLCEIFGCTSDYLLGLSDRRSAAVVPVPVREIDQIFDGLNHAGQTELCSYGRYLGSQDQYRAKEPPKKDAPTKIVPLLGAAFAAGAPETPGDLFTVDFRTADMRADFAIHVNGNSMEPWLPDGSVALGVKRLPRDGEVGAFWLDGGFLVKQCCTDPFGNVYLFALNRDRADADETILANSGRDLRPVGTILLDAKIPLP